MNTILHDIYTVKFISKTIESVPRENGFLL